MANKLDHFNCTDAIKPVRDALDVINGKWKLPLIISMKAGNIRFTAIQHSIPGLTPKVLAKELKEMELNKLITREVDNGYPVVISYGLTDYAASLKPIISALKSWGENHRKVVFKRSKLPAARRAK